MNTITKALIISLITPLMGGIPPIFAQSSINKELVISQIEATARVHGADPALLLSIASVESSFNPKAIGAKGEIGLYQFRPEFHKIKITHSVEEQTRLAISYLQELKRLCGSKYLQCWNMGPTRALAAKIKHTKYEGKISNAYKNFLDYRSISPAACSPCVASQD